MRSNSFSIYVHIPFCRERCHYCDFLTAPLRTGGVDDHFIDILCKEIGLWRDYLEFNNLNEVETIYFGGGTPSLCSPEQVDKIIKTISYLFKISSDAEVTIEANPLDLNLEKCSGFVESGVNRISIGGQSSKNETLNLMGRYHTHDQTEAAIEFARGGGFQNISLDLIYGMPNQEIKDLETDLEKFCRLKTEHLSCYQLTLSKNHPWKRVQAVDSKLNDFDFKIQEYLENFGYERYEISNYAVNGMRSRHNSIYWSWKPYLAIGPGAHGFFPKEQAYGVRYRNFGSLKKYADSVEKGVLPRPDPHRLSRDEANLEFLMTHLRVRDGFCVEKYADIFGEPFNELIDKNMLNRVVKNGLLSFNESKLSPTKRGQLVSEEIAWKLCKNN